MGLVSVIASNLDQSIAGDIVEIGGYWRTMSSRSFRVGRSVTGLGLFAIKVIKRWSIDGSPRWNVARYINHSCRPNAKPVGRKGGIVIVALHQIEPGEEITYDYGREYLKCFLDNGGCRCAACRRKKAIQRRRTHPRGKRKAAKDTCPAPQCAINE